MKPSILIMAGVALFAIGLNSATAGPCTREIDVLSKALGGKDASAGWTPGAAGEEPGKGAALPSAQHPPTAVMSRETQGIATSAEDVRRQNAGQPTAAEAATPPSPSTNGKAEQASLALNQARTLDQQGKEADCLEAVQQVKKLVGRS